MLYVTIHAAWMILAVAVGTVAGYQGLLRATQRPGRPSLLPGRFLLKSHIRFGTVFYLMLYAGILYGWAMHEFLFRGRSLLPPTIGAVHLVLALVIGALYGLAWAVGLSLTRHPAGAVRARPRLHMALNFTACTLVAVQIALAVYYVWIWPTTL